MSQIEFLEFSMRREAPKAGADWFRIVENKKGDGPAKVYIYDEIGYWGTTAKDFAALVDAIDASEIHLYINSPGGSVFDGLAIGASIKEHKATVTGKVTGMAASAASFILQYCDNREITRNAQVMIHDAKAYAGGTADQMRRAAEVLDRVSDNIADIYSIRSGQGTKESWRETMKSGDVYYDGNEALDAGLVDVVTDNPIEEEEDAPEESSKNSWSHKEIENFLLLPAAQLAKDASRPIITNRVEEAHMSGANTPQNQQTQPAVAQPPAPVTTPAAQVTAPAPAAPAATDPFKFTINGSEVTDFSAVQSHIVGLETFKKETIEGSRKNFVKQLAEGNKILATEENIANTEKLALSMSTEQFDLWKASMDAAPSSPLFQQHGAPQGNGGAPVADAAAERAQKVAVLEEIVQGHKDSGMSQEMLENLNSYKELQALKAQV